MVGPSGPQRSQVLSVFVLAVAWLSWGIWDVTLASGFTDPVRQIRTQDEALYSSISIGMAERNEWLTPRFMGRLAFVKPWLAYLPAAVSVKVFGVSNWSLRLPALLLGAFALTLAWRMAGWGAFCLLGANATFFTLARANMTDVPLLAFTMAALQGGWGWAAAGVMVKSVAALPAVIFERRNWLWIAAAVAPWHLYHLVVNTEWYWKEHILDEHLHWGLAAAAQEPAWRFYPVRAWEADPVLALAALPLLIWRRDLWLGLAIGTLFLFGYRNPTYLLPVFAATALLAGREIKGWWLVLPAALLLWRAPELHRKPAPVPSYAAAMEYAALGRPQGLLAYGLADEFVLTTLPLARVQYVLPGNEPPVHQLDFRARRIVLFGDEYGPTRAPEGTLYLVRNDAERARLFAAAKGQDLLLPEGMESPAHRPMAARNGFRIWLCH
jgi:hypothetical protein